MSALQPADLSVDLLTRPELGRIASTAPRFGWTVRATHSPAVQHAFQIQVATSREALFRDDPDLWDSGEPDFTRLWKTDATSAGVPYEGTPLSPGSTCYWRVRTWLAPADRSPWSSVQAFTMAADLHEFAVSHYKPVVTRVVPREVVRRDDGTVFVDFGRAAFGTVAITIGGDGADPAVLQICLGEVLREPYRIERNPGGSRRYREFELRLDRGAGEYRVDIPPDERNTGSFAAPGDDLPFEVLPFRYAEICGLTSDLSAADVTQLAVHYPFDDEAGDFRSSSPVLNEVWQLCKYSIKATSFLGVYVDGDRERIPYEADAYIDGTAHMACDREYSMMRRSIDYLIRRPTWPTEWQFYLVLAAWSEYMHSGDERLVRHRWDDLVARALLPLRNEDGLVDITRVGNTLLESINFIGDSSEHFGKDAFRNIVDWPQVERDGHEMVPVNSVVNALHYRTLICLAALARRLERTDDAVRFGELARETRQAFGERLVDRATGLVVDGVGSAHSSLHSNMFAAASGILDESAVAPVHDFIRGRGMACSVYGSQMLLEGLYALGDGAGALGLMTGTGLRSWAHMIRDMGTTITAEAWDDSVKPNQDWNHAWGAAPAGIIPSRLLGVQPLEPGFAKVLIDPQTGGLAWVEGTYPTVRGPVRVRVQDDSRGPYTIEVEIPANVSATVGLPMGTPAGDQGAERDATVILDGDRVAALRRGSRVYVSDIGSGTHTISGATRR
jgi:hypothetical protein